MRAPRKKNGRRSAAASLSVRLGSHVTLEVQAGGEIAACFQGFSVGIGKFSASVVEHARELREGLAIESLSPDGRNANNEMHLLVRRLARRGLVEYRLGRSRSGKDDVIIEPQVADYWPQTPRLRDADVLVLSRFAYLRRRANEMVLESPRAGALFKISNPKIAAGLVALSTPQKVKQLRRDAIFDGAFLALLVDCQILFKVDAAGDEGLRRTEGDDDLVLWDFHDLLFHSRSTEGRHANPVGGLHPYAGTVAPPAAVRPRWPGKKIDLQKFSTASSQAVSQAAKLLRERHSTRSFDDQRPITLAELSRFLDGAARVTSTFKAPVDGGGPELSYAARPYPSGGASYELELYLAVDKCDGLTRGFYHYDAGGHALVPIGVRTHELDALLMGAELAMGAPAVPQILITIAARFGRTSWKYSSIAYSLILKDVGVLLQTLYIVATDAGLGGCAIGTTNIDLFAKMTGIDFHIEGPVGQFALGRGSDPGSIAQA